MSFWGLKFSSSIVPSMVSMGNKEMTRTYLSILICNRGQIDKADAPEFELYGRLSDPILCHWTGRKALSSFIF